MEQRLEELRQKQKKLIFLLGEKVEGLYRSGLLRFLYTSEGVKDEEDVLKLLRFLGYIEDRITKIVQICGEEDALTADGLAQKADEEEEAEEAEKVKIL